MRLFVEIDELIGDTLMQTPALREFRRSHPQYEIVYVTPEHRLSYAMLRENPHIDRFSSLEAAREEHRSEDRWLKLSSWDAMQFGHRNRRPMFDGFAEQFGVQLPADGYAMELPLTPVEMAEGLNLIESYGPNFKVVVCARHSTTCSSSLTPGAPATKCFSNGIWCEIAEWLILEGYIPLAVGAAPEASDPRFEDWPGARLYGENLRKVAAVIAHSRAMFCVETGLRFVAAALDCDVVCVAGATPTWLVYSSRTSPDQVIEERYIPVPRVTAAVCKEMLWKVL